MSEIDDKLYDRGLAKTIKPSLGSLRRRFLLPPFSVLNTRDGIWQDRRKRWLSLGIKSEIGRSAYSYEQNSLNALSSKMDVQKRGRDPRRMAYTGNEAFAVGYTDDKGQPVGSGKGFKTGTSVFDPVLCELAYTWWCPPAGRIIDPFAGGSVRGVVASVLGFRYWGCELREEQVEANKEQISESTVGEFPPKWICGDSAEKLKKVPDEAADFIFSCPPYGNLEKYSDDPRDISGMEYEVFLAAYYEIIRLSCEKLKNNRFACFVVANYRDGGDMRNFVGDTIVGFERAGLKFYNDAILVNAVGTGAMRTNTNFLRGARKLVKLHQNILVFLKGDHKEAGKVFEDA